MILTPKQVQALDYLTDDVTKYMGYGGAAGGGKSILGVAYLSQLAYYAGGTKYFIGRDQIKATKTSVVQTWTKYCKSIGFNAYRFTSDDHIVVYGKNGAESKIEFLDLSFQPQKDPMFERLGSKEYTAGWIEEAGQVHPLAFETLKTRVGRWYNEEFNILPKILCTFNPKKNWIDKTFYRPWKANNEESDTKFVFATVADNPHLPKSYVDSLRNLKDEVQKQRLLYGNFDYDDDPNALLDYKQISGIWNKDKHIKGQKYLTCDVARFGSDNTVYAVWNGFTIVHIESDAYTSVKDVVNRIRILKKDHNIPIHNVIIDEDGVGGGVVDLFNGNATGFVNNSKASTTNYQNLKSECGYSLASNFDKISVTANVSVADKDIIEEDLGQLKSYKTDDDGKLKILPKKEIKANIGRSPDFLDIFIMRMYPEVNNVTPSWGSISM